MRQQTIIKIIKIQNGNKIDLEKSRNNQVERNEQLKIMNMEKKIRGTKVT